MHIYCILGLLPNNCTFNDKIALFSLVPLCDSDVMSNHLPTESDLDNISQPTFGQVVLAKRLGCPNVAHIARGGCHDVMWTHVCVCVCVCVWCLMLHFPSCVSLQFSFHKECGSDNNCNSNLQLTAEYAPEDTDKPPYPRGVWVFVRSMCV